MPIIQQTTHYYIIFFVFFSRAICELLRPFSRFGVVLSRQHNCQIWQLVPSIDMFLPFSRHQSLKLTISWQPIVGQGIADYEVRLPLWRVCVILNTYICWLNFLRPDVSGEFSRYSLCARAMKEQASRKKRLFYPVLHRNQRFSVIFAHFGAFN